MVTSFLNPFTDLYNKATSSPDYSVTYKGIFNELLNKCINIFEVKGLPETVNTRYFLTSLILTGDCALWKCKGEWVAVKGTRGAEPDGYYLPTEYVIANPIFGSGNVKINSNEIEVFFWTSTDELMYTSSNGMYPLLDRTARVLTDIHISIICALKNSRVTNIFTATTNAEKEALNRLITDMRLGKDAYTALQSLTSKMQVNPVVDNTDLYRLIQEFVELEQFTLAQFYHSIAVNSNYNLKRAQINNEEIMTNSYILVVNLFDTEQQLKQKAKEFNSKSGLNISIDYSEAWKKLQEMEERPVGEKSDENSENNLVDQSEENSDENLVDQNKETTEDKKSEDEKSEDDKSEEKEGDEDDTKKKNNKKD